MGKARRRRVNDKGAEDCHRNVGRTAGNRHGGPHHHPDAITFPGLLIWRPGGDLFFASIGHFQDGLKSALIGHPAKSVLLDVGSVNLIDTSACDALLTVIKELQDQGIIVTFARVRDEVRERMRVAGIEAMVDANNFYERVTDGVREYSTYRIAP